MEHVQEAVGHLYTLGKPLTIRAISTATGISPKGLRKYARVRAFLQGVLRDVRLESRRRRLRYEDELQEKAQQAVRKLVQAGKPITHQSVGLLIGIPPSTIIRFSRLKKLIQHYVDYSPQQRRRTEEREQALLEEVRAAVLDLKAHQQPITYTAVSKSSGIHNSAWLAYPQVRAFVEGHLDSMYLRTTKEQEQREEALLLPVEEALRHWSSPGSLFLSKLLGSCSARVQIPSNPFRV